MLEKWTGEVVGTMHIYGITSRQLAAKMGIKREYLSALLNCKRNIKSAESNIRTALMELIRERENAESNTQ